MKLFDFEKNIPQKILDRGMDYHYEGAVLELLDHEEGEWRGLVLGSRSAPYQVKVSLDGEDILSWSCTCPYTTGAVCKHVVAVLYELQEIMELEAEGNDGQEPAATAPVNSAAMNGELFARFKDLSDAEQRSVKIATLCWNPFAPALFVDIFNRSNFKYNGSPMKAADFRALADKLVNQGFLVRKRGEYQCVQSFAHELCERFFAKDADFNKIVWAIRASSRHSFWQYHQLPADFFREMRFARYTGEPDVFRRNYFNLVNHHHREYNQTFLLDFWLSPPFDAQRLEALPERIRDFLLTEKLNVQTFELSPSGGWFHYAVSRLPIMHPEDRRPVARLAAQLYLLRGDWKGLERALAYARPADAEAIRGIWRLLHGDTGGALESFDASLKIVRKEAGSRREELKSLFGIFQILARLKTRDGAWLPKIEKHIAQLQKEYSTYRPVYRWLDAVRLFLQNDRKAAVHKLKEQEYTPVLLNFFKFFCAYWIDERLVDRRELEAFFRQVADNGYDWLAAQTLALWNQLEPGDEEREKAEARYFDQLGGVEPLWRLLPRIEEWENALNMLSMIGALNQKAAGKHDSRLVWMVDFQYKRIMARHQSYGKNGWTKGRPVAYDRLQRRELDCMTEQDQRIVAALGFGSGTELHVREELVWKELCNHPLLFLWQSPGTAVQLLEDKLHLSVREEGDGYRVSLSHPVESSGLQIVKEMPTRYLVIEVDERLSNIARAIGGGSLRVPPQGAERLKEVVAGLSGIVSVQSVFEDENLPAVEPDDRLHLHLLPVGDGFHVELYVKPFREAPPYVKPGEGAPTLITLLAGQRTSTTRDLKAENKELKRVLAQIPMLERHSSRQGIWELEEAEQCLQLLLQIEPLVQQGDLILEWPKGEKFRIAKVAEFDQLRLDIRGRGHWFEVEGELAVDEDQVLTIQELLRLSEEQGQFIELSAGKFLALTEEFKRRLREASGLLKPQKKGGPLQLHPLAAPALDDFIGSLRQVTTDAAFRDSRERLEAAFAQQFKPSKKFKATLRSYQREGFEWLQRCAAWGVGACLADDMGLGKTIQALAVLMDRAQQGPALVVAPASVCRNWRAETEKFAPGLRPILFGEGDREATIDEAGPGDLIIVTYDLMTREHDHFVKKTFATVILDEAQAIKNRATKRSETAMQLQADFRMILTGTPLENHLGELWNLFQFINPGLLGTIEQFNDQFTLPIEKYRDEERRDQLRKLVQPFILRRRKDEVLKELPEKTEVTLTVELPPEERAFYEALRRSAIEKLTADTDAKGGEQHLRILAELMRLRRAACHPRLVDENAGFASSAKLRLFAEIVEELLDNGHKALVFSQFVGHLKILEAYLQEKKIAYQYLDGQTPLPKRQERIEAFQSGQGDLFLISLKAGGVGLNLTAADYVIHTDPWWNPAVEDQATDRAHRIGQDKPVTVYRLVAENTIEEKILQLHEQKRDLADSLLAGTDVSARMTAADLLALMAED